MGIFTHVQVLSLGKLRLNNMNMLLHLRLSLHLSVQVYAYNFVVLCLDMYIMLHFNIAHAVRLYQLCGDNIDKNVKRHYFRADNSPNTLSLHYFHFYAVKDRVDFSDMGEEPIQCQQVSMEQVALSLLPSPEDDIAIRRNICIMISRVLFNNLPYFKHTFDGVIEWHIEHPFYKEMCKQSEWVSYEFRYKFS